MNGKNLFRNLVALVALATVTGVVVTPAIAQDKKPSAKTTKKTVKTASAKMYECKECKLKFTAAEAKKKGFKCDCGCKLTVVKTAKKTEPKRKS